MVENRDPLFAAFDSPEEGEEHWVDDRQEQPETPAPRSAWAGFLGRFSRGGNGQYSQVSAGEGGTDGVFGNLVAKVEGADGSDGPERSSRSQNPDDDDITPAEMPPTYEEAAADSTPSYWETTIMASGWCDEVLVDDLPVGNLLHFGWNMLISGAFSFVGFFITFAFHTTHAARGGSLVGFGATLIQTSYSFTPENTGIPGAPPSEFHPDHPNSFESGAVPGVVTHMPSMSDAGDQYNPDMEHNMMMSRLIFIVGCLVIFKGVVDYLRARSVKAAILRYQSENNQSGSDDITMNETETETETEGSDSSESEPIAPVDRGAEAARAV